MTPPSDAEIAAVVQWDKDEWSVKSPLTQKIPDSTLMHIHKKLTVKEQWEAIVTEYTEKGAYAQTDLCSRFLESKCPEKGNIQEFLRVKWEELASVGVDIDEKDYKLMIILSLPFSLGQLCIITTCCCKAVCFYKDNSSWLTYFPNFRGIQTPENSEVTTFR